MRGEGGHIIGFDNDADPDTPYTAEYFADAPYNDAGFVYTPDGVLLTNQWPPAGLNFIKPGGEPNLTLPNALGGLSFVPEGLPGAGQLKAVGLWPSNTFNTVNFSPDGTFPDGTPRYKIDSVKFETRAGSDPGSVIYVPLSAP